MIAWTEKYRPEILSDIIGNDKAVTELKKWAEDWNVHKKTAILYGPPGIGKTSAAYALANDMGWETIELNASEQRTAAVIQKIAGSAAQTGTFLGGASGRRLIILDEADNIYGDVDQGGVKAIGELIKKTHQPIVLIANEYYDMSKTLRGSCKPIQFRGVQSRSIMPLLRRICQEEGIDCDEGAIELIGNRAGDVRSAINDLQAIAQGRKKVHSEDVVIGIRDTKESIFDVMKEIFKGSDPKRALYASYSLDENPEDFIHWIDENLPREYKGEDLAKGFEALSRSDVFLGRVRRRQNYGLWKYAGEMMTCGVQAAKSKKHHGYVPYKSPAIWKKMGQAKSVRVVRDSIAAKIGKHCHASQRYARSELIPFLKAIFRKNAIEISAMLDLSQNEIAFLLG
ncbi:MAG: replication factor C large subunit, partial [Methanocellales archaeon]|nr:replication factor C large subunit [Methanocellales archaeon]MDD3292087.1 replication factor C large subunit [Methanocellales archaeon]MDD5235324.1 replication factor C large subunit [Methanocellales archaeon]MDD5485728.1 replication factor C large subunit [Methanocellales archaeon]